MKPTLHFGGNSEDADRFFERTLRTAAALRGLGIGAGDGVATLLHNEPACIELMLAARAVQARCCLIDRQLGAAEAGRVLADSGAKLLVGHNDLLAEARAGIPTALPVFGVAPQPATLRALGLADCAGAEPRFESWQAVRDGGQHGPSGPALAARLPELPAQTSAAYATAFGIGPGMRALISAPLCHAAPAAYACLAALNDAGLWIEPRFDAERTLRLIEAERITHLYLVPAMFARLLRLPRSVRTQHDLRSLEFVATSGSPCTGEVKRRMIDWWGPVVHEAYVAGGLGVATHIDSGGALHKPGSCGRALSGVRLRVMDAQGRVLPAGQAGLIYARGHDTGLDFVCAGSAAMRQAPERDGLRTFGDIGRLDDEGDLYLVERQVDVVISGGVGIDPAAIERVLADMPGIDDCAVFGIPDHEYGQTLAAAVQPTPRAGELDEAQVRSWLRERIAGYKVPSVITFHAELPREETGKILKARLRAPYWIDARSGHTDNRS